MGSFDAYLDRLSQRLAARYGEAFARWEWAFTCENDGRAPCYGFHRTHPPHQWHKSLLLHFAAETAMDAPVYSWEEIRRQRCKTLQEG